MTDKMKKLILAVDAAGLPDYWLGTQFHRCSRMLIADIMQDSGLMLGVRGPLETNKAYRQIIPYVVVRCEDKYLMYTRTENGGESRLHGRSSIGIGGHIDIDDVVEYVDNGIICLDGVVAEAARRELWEELQISTASDGCKNWVGIVGEVENEVGFVHIGIVIVVDIREDDKQFILVEDELCEVSFQTMEELEQRKDSMELWSQLLLPHLSTF